MPDHSYTKTEDPLDRPSRVADAMLDAASVHIERRDDDAVVVFYYGHEERRAACAFVGYEDSEDAIGAALAMISAMVEARPQ